MSDAPGDSFVMTEMRESWNTRKCQTNCVELWTIHVELVIHVGELDTSVRIPR